MKFLISALLLILAISPINAEWEYIRHVGTGLYLDVDFANTNQANDETPFKMSPWTGSDSQKWNLGGRDGIYTHWHNKSTDKIVNAHYLDYETFSTKYRTSQWYWRTNYWDNSNFELIVMHTFYPDGAFAYRSEYSDSWHNGVSPVDFNYLKYNPDKNFYSTWVWEFIPVSKYPGEPPPIDHSPPMVAPPAPTPPPPPPAANTILDLSCIYGMRSIATDHAIEAFNAERTAATNAQGGKYWAHANQIWQLIELEADSPYIYIRNTNSGKNLQIHNGTNLLLADPLEVDEQLWQVSASDAGGYQFTSKANGQRITIDETLDSASPNIFISDAADADNQRWILEKFSQVPIFFGNYQIYHENRILGVEIGLTEDLDVLGLPIDYPAPDLVDPIQEPWRIVPTTDGYHLLTSRDFGTVLSAGILQDLTNPNKYSVFAEAQTLADNQQWMLTQQEDGTYGITSRDGKLLGYTGLEGQDICATAGEIEGINYNWNLRQTRNFIGLYNIESVTNGEHLQTSTLSNDNGTEITTGTQITVSFQDWAIENRDGTHYVIVNLYSLKVLDVQGSSSEAGAVLQQFEYLGTPNQHWSIIPVDSQNFKIISNLSDLALTRMPDDEDSHLNTRLQAYTGADTQHWRLLPIHESTFQALP